MSSAILVIGLKVMIQNEAATDPWWMRIAVASLFVVLLLLSFSVEWVRQRIVGCFVVGIIAIIGHLSWLILKNDFDHDFVAAMYIATVASALLFDERKPMALVAIIGGLMLIAITVFAPHPPPNVYVFLGINLLVLLLGNAVVAARANTHSKYELELSRMLTLQEAAVENNSDAILLVDENGNYLKSNTAFSEMWSVSQKTLLEHSPKDVEALVLSRAKNPTALAAVWDTQTSSLQMGELREAELLNGNIIAFYWRPMINDDVLIGRLWLFRDVTSERMREKRLVATEQQLRRQNERLMDFASSFARNAGNFESSFREITSVSAELLQVDTVAVWFFDKAKETMTLRLSYDRLSEEFSSGATVKLKDHPAYFSELFQNRVLVVNDTRAHGSTQEFFQGKYSGPTIALMHAQIHAHGESIGIMSIESSTGARGWTLEDQNYAASLADLVSIAIASEERQRAQDELTNSLAILQAIFDLSETGIIVEDTQHKILKYNELYLKIWGMTKEFVDTQPYPVLLGRCLEQLKDTNLIQEGLQNIQLRPGMEYAGILEFHDGKIIERYSKALIADGVVTGRVWFYLDITERKRKELDLINRNFELDSFVYRASHDLKAPLNSIMGLISLIQEENELASILRYVAMMNKSVKKLDDFIRQLTQFSQDARLKIVRKSILFRELIQDILDDLKFMENAARLQVTLDVDQSGEFYSDPVRLAIIFSNFLSNAIKYQDLKKERSTLLIRIRANSETVECVLEDNGLGIAESHLEKVFDLFFRASVQATGSGLGLYITRNAIDKLGGTVRVSSQLGQGTTFVLTFPNLPDEEGGPKE